VNYSYDAEIKSKSSGQQLGGRVGEWFCCFVKPFSSHFSIRKVRRVGVYVPAKPDVGIGLTTNPEAGKVPPDTSTTGAPDIPLRLL
jgi:hypothetical protein